MLARVEQVYVSEALRAMTHADKEQSPIRRSKATQASLMTPAQRFHAGFELFEVVRSRMIAGIRADAPQKSDSEVEAEFIRRLRLQRDREERPIYRVVQDLEAP